MNGCSCLWEAEMGKRLLPYLELKPWLSEAPFLKWIFGTFFFWKKWSCVGFWLAVFYWLHSKVFHIVHTITHLVCWNQSGQGCALRHSCYFVYIYSAENCYKYVYRHVHIWHNPHWILYIGTMICLKIPEWYIELHLNIKGIFILGWMKTEYAWQYIKYIFIFVLLTVMPVWLIFTSAGSTTEREGSRYT